MENIIMREAFESHMENYCPPNDYHYEKALILKAWLSCEATFKQKNTTLENKLKIAEEALGIINLVAQIRIYNSCDVFKGVMIRDNKIAYDAVKKSRHLLAKIREGKII